MDLSDRLRLFKKQCKRNIQEFFCLLRYMQPAGKWRLGILGAYGLTALIVSGYAMGYLSITYILLSISAVIVFLIIIMLETFNQR